MLGSQHSFTRQKHTTPLRACVLEGIVLLSFHYWADSKYTLRQKEVREHFAQMIRVSAIEIVGYERE